MATWQEKTKRLLKSELVKRGISHIDLVTVLKNIGIFETKASIDSKISRGTFSAAFFLQCLTVVKCTKIEIQETVTHFNIASEPYEEYHYEKEKI